MRATEERRGNPDRSMVGRARSSQLEKRSPRALLPSWETAERPSLPLVGDVAYNEDTGEYETYNGTAWVDLSGATTVAVPFSATGSFTYAHGRGVQPVVNVVDSLGKQVDVVTAHIDENTVGIFYLGSLSGTLILN